MKRAGGLGPICVRTSHETAKRPYKKRMECDQAKMISRRLKEELTTARGANVRYIQSARTGQRGERRSERTHRVSEKVS